jgi:hypothetical protein
MAVKKPTPTRLAAAALLAALLLVAAAATALPEAPLRILAPLLGHAVHLACAFALGRALLRIPGAAPREALDVIVSSLAAGLVGLALLTLVAAATIGCPWWMPWAVDALALLLGLVFGRLRDALLRILEPWGRRDMAVVVASRLPLHVALGLVACMHFVPPFLPPTFATGAAALALPSQAALRSSLGAACAALPESVATPSQALLLHGYVSGGPAGALLFGTTALVLLAAAAWLHAHRHLGDFAAAWTALILLSAPLLLPETAADPSLELMLLFAFLAFHEVADWCQRATGGKIGLASIYGGFLVAESARGLAAFVVILLFLFLVQALIDRNGFLRQVPGLLGMSGIALLVATPFLVTAGSLSPDGPAAALAERYVPDPLRERAGLRDVAASSAHAVAATDEEPTELGDIASDLASQALKLGPLLLGLLAALPLVPLPPEPLRHSVLAALLFTAFTLLPAPYGGAGALLLAPAALAAGATAASLVAQRGIVGKAGAAFAALALPASVAMALAAGPDIPLGAGLLLGRVPREDYLRAHAPDAPLIETIAARGVTKGKALLLAGTVTDEQYSELGVLVRREPGFGVTSALSDLVKPPEPVEAIGLDRRTAPPETLRVLADRDVLAEPGGGRWALISLEKTPPPPPPPSPAAPEPEAAPEQPPARRELGRIRQ